MREKNIITPEYEQVLEGLIDFKKQFNFSYQELSDILDYDRQHLEKIFNKRRIVKLDKLKSFQNELEYYKSKNKGDMGNSLIIDYLRIRFENLSANNVLANILKLPDTHSEEIKCHRYGYDTLFKFGSSETITLTYNGDRDTLGCILQLSGEGCRWFEGLRHFKSYDDWKKFFINCSSIGAKYLRADLALNDCDGVLSIPSMIRDIKNGDYVSRFKTFKPIIELKDGMKAHTLYCGRIRSDVYFCIYEKGKELYFKGKIDDPEYSLIINRFEIRYKHERADWLVEQLLNGYDFIELFYATVDRYLNLSKNKGFKRFLKHDDIKVSFEIMPKSYDIENLLNQLKKQYGSTLTSLKRNFPKEVNKLFNCKPSKKLEAYFELKRFMERNL